MIRDRLTAVVLRGAGFLFIMYELLLHLGVFSGEMKVTIFMYYTIQSNLLALILFGLLFFRSLKAYIKEGRYGKTGYFARFEMVATVDLLLTLIVYWVLLAPGAFNMGEDSGLFSFGNLSVHLITPLLCLIDYVLFTESKHLKYPDVYAIIIYPLAYVVFTTITGNLGYIFRYSVDGSPVRFPYFFFDYDQVGVGQALINIAVLVAAFLVISHLLYLIDRKWKKPVLIKEKV